MPEPHVLYYCHFAQQNGYARAAEDYCMALHRAGVNLKIVPLTECDTANLDPEYGELIDLAICDLDAPPTHAIFHGMPLTVLKYGSTVSSSLTRICVTTWEAMPLPRNIADDLYEMFDLIIVPSKGCQAAVGGENTRVLPHCFDTELWKPASKAREEDDTYSFYTVNGHTTRKNLKGLLTAYLTAFGPGDDVVLSILATRNFDDVASLVNQVRHASRLEWCPDVHVVGECMRLNATDLRDFHAYHDCYVTASRGEGFGLGPCEARMVGNFLIAPYYDVVYQEPRDVPEDAREATWWEVMAQGTPAVAFPELVWREVRGQKYPALRTAPNGLDGHQLWWEPNLQNLMSLMRLAFHTKRTGNLGDLGTLLSYETIGAEFKRLLEEAR